MTESLKVEEKGAQSDTLPRPMPAVAKVVEDALARNGYHLKVSVKTVETYRSRIIEKLKLKDSGELVQYAVQWLQSNATGR
jgi:FixJ family two-component response regulator